jgi:hypothetical protein
VVSAVLDYAGIGCCVEYAQVAFSSLERLFISARASATASKLLTSILLCLHTSANIVTAQSAKAIKANSTAVGPLSFPPWAAGRSQTTLCVLELSTTERTLPISLAVTLYFGIFSLNRTAFAREFKSYAIQNALASNYASDLEVSIRIVVVLPAPLGAKEAEDLSLLYCEAYMVYCSKVTVIF